ncbi:hypothetical protein E0500_004915 [Streptomyces sp. KM273126]|uniref:hypothetical protein n=1 Tax=Streptomyces sp. KM273126 TaxID=2545247 RepID=UPI00140493A1|nr:hypothetical protein [Streptomyces sp. KM273126]MBA2806811.1 hypothetical protein [Streptomyces sp. KM273126]
MLTSPAQRHRRERYEVRTLCRAAAHRDLDAALAVERDLFDLADAVTEGADETGRDGRP